MAVLHRVILGSAFPLGSFFASPVVCGPLYNRSLHVQAPADIDLS